MRNQLILLYKRSKFKQCTFQSSFNVHVQLYVTFSDVFAIGFECNSSKKSKFSMNSAPNLIRLKNSIEMWQVDCENEHFSHWNSKWPSSMQDSVKRCIDIYCSMVTIYAETYLEYLYVCMADFKISKIHFVNFLEIWKKKRGNDSPWHGVLLA